MSAAGRGARLSTDKFGSLGGYLKVLLLENISGVAASQFEEAGFEVESLNGALAEGELVEKVRGTSILGTRSKTQVTAGVVDAAPGLVSGGGVCIGVGTS